MKTEYQITKGVRRLPSPGETFMYEDDDNCLVGPFLCVDDDDFQMIDEDEIHGIELETGAHETFEDEKLDFIIVVPECGTVNFVPLKK